MPPPNTNPANPLPTQPIIPFPNTAFTTTHPNTLLTSPSTIRTRNLATGHPKAADLNRPPPVCLPELGLLVKYGTQVARAELEAQLYVYHQLNGRVPVPEVFGWAEEGGQGFVYMALVDGSTLAERWGGLTETERLVLCGELGEMVKAWRGLRLEGESGYVGSVNNLPLNDIIVKDYPHLAGPFRGTNSTAAVEAFQITCDIEINLLPPPDQPGPIVFTHGDVVACNVLVTPGPNPRVAAVIDWAQAGWYPWYWEWCKAKWVRMPNTWGMDDAAQDEWQGRWLRLVVRELPEGEVWYPWLRFSLAH